MTQHSIYWWLNNGQSAVICRCCLGVTLNFALLRSFILLVVLSLFRMKTHTHVLELIHPLVRLVLYPLYLIFHPFFLSFLSLAQLVRLPELSGYGIFSYYRS